METRLLTIAKDKGIKFKKLAELLGIDYSTFWRKAKGRSSFSNDQLICLSKFLGVSLEELSDEEHRV